MSMTTDEQKQSYKQFAGSTNWEVGERLLSEVVNTLFLPASTKQEDRDKLITWAMMTVMELAPKDGLEGILVTQMVATHSAAMECFRRASIESQTFEGRNLSLNHAQKLLRLYLEQMKTLNAQRGHNDPKVNVGQVNVAAGGQAIVGNVDVHGRSAKESPIAIEHQNTQPFNIDMSATKARAAEPVKNAKRKK